MDCRHASEVRNNGKTVIWCNLYNGSCKDVHLCPHKKEDPYEEETEVENPEDRI